MTHFKSLKVNKTTSQIVMEHENTEHTYAPERRLRAVSILLGGYNSFGRKIDLSEFESMKDKFEDLIHQVELKME